MWGKRKIRNCRKPDLRREKEELLQDKHKKWWFVEIWQLLLSGQNSEQS